MINVVAFPWHNCTEECDVSVSSRLVSGGAEEAGMKGWRGRSRIPPEGAKARFTRVSRGLAPQVSFFSSPCHHQQHIHSSIYGGVRPSLSTDEAGIHRTDIAAEAEVAAAALQAVAQGTRGFGVSRSLAYK